MGKIRPGQVARLRFDAYSNETFTGRVVQVRLQPITVQNVVSYGTVIEVPNTDLKLKPGMTANVQIEIAKRADVLRVPAAAIRFRPTEEIFAAFNQPVPPEMQPRTGANAQNGRRAGAGAGQAAEGRGDAATTTSARSQSQGQRAQPAAAPAAGTSAAPATGRASERGGGDRAQGAGSQPGFNRERGEGGQGGQFARGGEGRQGFSGPGGAGGQGTGGGRRGFDPNDPEARARMIERYQQMPADQRAQWASRMKERGIDIEALVKQGGKPSTGRAAASPASAAGAGPMGGATTIDALFGPLPVRETQGRAWLWLAGQKQLKSVRMRLGITDGQYYELLEGDLQPGTDLVISVTLGTEGANRTGASPSGNPLMQRGGMPGGPGGFGGRGR